MITAAQLFRQALREHWRVYALGCFTMLMTSTSEVLVPKFVQWCLDLLTTRATSKVPAIFHKSDLPATLSALALALLGILVMAWVGRVGWRQTFARRTHEAGYILKNRFWDALRHEPLTTFQRYPLGDLMNRAIADWNNTRSIHGFTLVMTFDVVYFTILALTAMFFINWQLTLAFMVVMPLLPRPIIRLTHREGALHEEAQERLSSLSDIIAQSISSIRLQRATASEKLWRDRLYKEADEYAKQRYAVLKTGWKIFPLGAFPTLFAYGVLLSWGLSMIYHGTLTIGEFVALQSYVLLLQSPLFELGPTISEWRTGFTSFNRMCEIFNLKHTGKKLSPKPAAPTSELAGDYAVHFEDFSFAYQDEQVLLSQINLRIPRGANIGITGPVGSGKSTLLKGIAGLLDDYDGSLHVFGQAVRQSTREWLTKKVVVVPQRSLLFSGSIRHNLRLGDNFSDDELWRVLELVSLADEVRRFSGGLDAWIGEWGINLSGGQKQRLALARALLRPSGVLLLDDCLSAVDALTEEKILRGFARTLADQTIVWVAHRLSTLKLCQDVYHLGDGRLERLPN